jgi:glycolate oxidase iron-sulfur subunit
VAATGAPLLISANPGCSLQIASALAARGQDIAVAHTAEILDASIRGRPLRALLG